jgi:hypothetical protein
MPEFTRFHLPLTRQGSKNSSSGISSRNPQLILQAPAPSKEFSFYAEKPRSASPQYTTTFAQSLDDSSNADLVYSQSDLADSFGQLSRPSFQEERYSNTNRYFASDFMEMASPSKNNFARQNLSMMGHNQEDHEDTLTPSPVIEYDLTDNGFFNGDGIDSRHRSNSHARNKSGESSTSTKWWKLPRQRNHHKSSSSSTHPTIDTGRDVSSRASSFGSIRGAEFDVNSSTASFSNQSNFAVDTSPPVSPPLDSFTFPRPHNQPLSPYSAESRQTWSRDGFGDGRRSLHSKKSSLSSNGHCRQKSSQSIDNPANFMLSSQDKWSMQLGHANYTIIPEPYTPDFFDLSTWHKLLEDRETAQAEYCKHKARTIEHYGLNTQTFRLTEAKWAEINGEWEKIVRMAKKCLMARGFQSAQLTATAASQNVKMPALNPHVDGKFPKLGDEDIVGPMAQSEPIYSREPSPVQKASLTKWKLDRLFGKSSSQS